MVIQYTPRGSAPASVRRSTRVSATWFGVWKMALLMVVRAAGQLIGHQPAGIE
jgi:hypothetical protein